MSFRLINKHGSTNKPLYESERLEWSSFGTLSNEIECSITEFKKGRTSDRDIIYFKAALDFLNSVLEAEKDEIINGKAHFAKSEHLTNRAMFVHGWANSGLSFPKNEEGYHEEMKGFIGAFEKMAQKNNLMRRLSIS